MEWEVVDQCTMRAKVPNGWLVKHWDGCDVPDGEGGSDVIYISLDDVFRP